MDFEAQRIIEALRSGIPSRIIGGRFSFARTELLAELSEWLEAEEGGGRIITANYGEGKTHLLGTVFNMARSKNMAVSMLSLSKETPMNQPHVIYQKIAHNTYLPSREQPGFESLLGQLGQAESLDLQVYAAKGLQTDKLFFLLRAFANTDNPEYKFSMQADLHGDFLPNAQLKKVYGEIFGEKISFSANFAKTRHIDDYYRFVRRLFDLSGLNGWVILFDEAEYIGRLGRKSRLKAYANMEKFLKPEYKNIHSLFAMHASYAKEVIEGKDEWKGLQDSEGIDKDAAGDTLTRIETAQELLPLTSEELSEVITRILDFHARAYGWTPGITAAELFEAARTRGHLLRTKIRAAIEYLDQLLQYGEADSITTGELDLVEYVEEIPLPEDL